MSQATDTHRDLQDRFVAIGRAAYANDESAAPALNAAVMKELEGHAVGDPRNILVMKAFTRGFDAAADEAATAVLANL